MAKHNPNADLESRNEIESSNKKLFLKCRQCMESEAKMLSDYCVYSDTSFQMILLKIPTCEVECFNLTVSHLIRSLKISLLKYFSDPLFCTIWPLPITLVFGHVKHVHFYFSIRHWHCLPAQATISTEQKELPLTGFNERFDRFDVLLFDGGKQRRLVRL